MSSESGERETEETEMKSTSSSDDTKPLLVGSKIVKVVNDTNVVVSVPKNKGGLNGLLSSILYTVMSVSMVLVNKAISANLKSGVKERLPDFSVVFVQCVIAVVLVELAKLIGIVEYPSFNLNVAKAWLPVNLLFIGMLCSGFISLTYLSIPMATVLKNLTNIFTILGDWFLFTENISCSTIVAIALMTFGAVMAGFNDLQYSFEGYVWTGINCLFTAAYILYMRHASSTINLPRFGMVAYNNLLSAVMLFPMCFRKGEIFYHFPQIFYDSDIFTPFFTWSVVLTGVIGFGLNFSSLWCVSSTSATTYAIVGTLNKVPITVLGFMLFDTKLTPSGIGFVVLATLGGLLYGFSKVPK